MNHPSQTSPPLFWLCIGQRHIPLGRDTALTGDDLSGGPPDTVVARVNPNPQDGEVLGLQNVSNRPWSATTPDGQQRTIDPQKTVRLADGTRIDFGGGTGQITATPPAADSPSDLLLHIAGNAFEVRQGLALPAGLLPHLGNAGIVAEVTDHPSQPGVLGLTNRSAATWSTTLTDGTTREVPPGKTVRLEAKVRIDFGNLQAEVTPAPGSAEGRVSSEAAASAPLAPPVPEAVSAGQAVVEGGKPVAALGGRRRARLALVGAACLLVAAGGIWWSWPRGSGPRDETLELVARLQSREAPERVKAARELGRRRVVKAIPQLVQLFKDEKYEVNKAGVEALVQIGAPAVPALIDGMAKEDFEPRFHAYTALDRIGAVAVPELIKLLQGPKSDAHEVAIHVLGRHREDALPSLAALLDSDDPHVRVAALRTLGEMRISVQSTMPRLLRLLKAEDSGTRASAAYVMARLGPQAKEAIPALIELLSDKEPRVRALAATALGEIGPLAAAAKEPLEKLAQDQDPRMRDHAQCALEQISGGWSRPPRRLRK